MFRFSLKVIITALSSPLVHWNSNYSLFVGIFLVNNTDSSLC